ncbi:alpha/beta fold hydrolase [Marimonas sp. MJW-29]|uniref:Alpha/beta fold hydrolase n=1 Tax=Sulfitobacter sediminis TaxID=3234186 RepID=A0ABV3RT22_9RHOB
MRTCLLNTKDGEELVYNVTGTGRPVLLIHGVSMWSDMWTQNGVAGKLGDWAKVIAPDLRGHGHSSRPHNPSSYGLKLVEDQLQVLDAEAAETVDVIGFSLGAEIALKLATIAPSRVSSLFLIGTGWTRDDGMDRYREFAEWARENGAGMTPNPDYDAFDALVDGMPEIICLAQEKLEKIGVRCAGVVGGNDPHLPDLEALVGVIPGFVLDKLVEVPHETSWRHLSIPERIQTFLDDVKS